MDNVIEVKNVSKAFLMGSQEVEVLRNIDLTVGQGEFVSIMGPSGSGKSTLLYLIGGIDEPTSGSIFIDGIDLSGMNDTEISKIRRNKIGFVFQFYNLVPTLTVEENILVPIMLDGKKVNNYKERADHLIELVGLKDRKKHRPGELSGGQQQRVAIARAMINNPPIILADEPIGNLDSASGNDIMNLLKCLCNEEKKTIVQVTHSIEAAKFGSRVINIKDGKVL